MNNKPLVSCIIIFFNAGEKFFVEAIESIFAQTYDHWELLLSDDGSTDESTEIALRYTQQYPEKVHYLEHEGHQNRGMSATRNLGIRHARGEYIAFLDADDIWLPHKLEQQVPILESHPEAAMLYGRTQYWFSWMKNNPTSSTLKSDAIKGDYMTITSIEFDKVINPPNQILLLLKNPNIYPCTCSLLIRKQVFETLGGFEETFQGANEDMVLNSKIFLKFPVYVSSECWDRYRRHEDSYWGNLSKQGILSEAVRAGRLKYLNWLEQYLLSQNIQSGQVWLLLQKALWPHRHPIIYGFIKQRVKETKDCTQKLGQAIIPVWARTFLANFIRGVVFRSSIKIIITPKKNNYSLNNWVVFCIVSNGESYLSEFIEHYHNKGIQEIILLDNGSTDRTASIASQYDGLTVLQTKTSFKYSIYKSVMEKYLIQRFSLNRPHICVEINELLNFPFQGDNDSLSLSKSRNLE